jgi:phage-related protein
MMVGLLVNKIAIITPNIEHNLSTTLPKGLPTIKDFVSLVQKLKTAQKSIAAVSGSKICLEIITPRVYFLVMDKVLLFRTKDSPFHP